MRGGYCVTTSDIKINLAKGSEILKYLREGGEGITIIHGLCERCEKKLKKIGSMAQKYCESCKVEVQREKTRERTQKYRERLKEKK